MANNKPIKKPANKKSNQKVNPLMIGAVAVAAIAISLVVLAPNKKAANTDKDTSSIAENASDEITAVSDTGTSGSSAKEAVLNEEGDVVINLSDITDKASFYEYDANGTTMGLFAVKASDGTIRTALNTCQVCNGSPYAFFEQQGDSVQCQNCGNQFSLDMIGQERGGCNPVPITDTDATTTDTQIVIPAKFLQDNAERFTNWKKF
ncbi:DUF2318 domain-containing protein [Anaerocolumna sp. AGMB13025]|jgi:hypothetical protein|uniref:DUF2318 domain-containing protein n=1 Tax=Anaerocolumna sp. AGMB13025 TaxID=3039116 RepID=UPI0024200456|nr:DUF2318 domain-containing protein [Anaerocolumna sp. AGMB13025]WFR59793.1 DUF2318 domain-containing protein [Anaerocolumna sp. AGMB13025]